MSRRKSGLASPETFTFRTSSTTVARRFRNYCYKEGLVMGVAIEKMIVSFLIAEGDVANEEALEVEEALMK